MPATQDELEEIRSQAARLETVARAARPKRPTASGCTCYGNIEFPYEVDHCVDRGADGVGLYRTEFLYLGSGDASRIEEVHFEAYRRVVAGHGRTSRSPSARSIWAPTRSRTASQARRRTQPVPRACAASDWPCGTCRCFARSCGPCLRASVLGNVQIMFPLVSTLLELRQAKMVLADVMEDLRGARHRSSTARLPVGMMVEVPAAVMMIDHFVDEVDFLSIGTNDLIQYTLGGRPQQQGRRRAVQRRRPGRAEADCDGRRGGRAASQIPVNLCGQMSGSPIYTMLLLGLGLRQFSVTPAAHPGDQEGVSQRDHRPVSRRLPIAR